MDGLGDADAVDMNRGPLDLRIPIAGRVTASDPVTGPGRGVDDAGGRMADVVQQDEQTSEEPQRTLFRVIFRMTFQMTAQPAKSLEIGTQAANLARIKNHRSCRNHGEQFLVFRLCYQCEWAPTELFRRLLRCHCFSTGVLQLAPPVSTAPGRHGNACKWCWPGKLRRMLGQVSSQRNLPGGTG
jgi:hypothetical protein